MFELNLPPFDANIKTIDNKLFILDKLRKKYVCLTPEEWVRQNFVNYLITEKFYPASLIVNEVQVSLNNQKKRCDTVIYDNTVSPVVIIEYKAPEVKITQDVFDQIVRYNIILKVKYLIVSNGLVHYCCKLDYSDMSYTFLSEIPDYKSLFTE